jgi:hypothetical protein
MTTTIKNLTDLHTLAADESLTQPIEIHLADDGQATAVYDGAPDVGYACLADLLGEHTIDAEDLVQYLRDSGDDELAFRALVAAADDDSYMLVHQTEEITDWTVYDLDAALEQTSAGGLRHVGIEYVAYSQHRGLYRPNR